MKRARKRTWFDEAAKVRETIISMLDHAPLTQKQIEELIELNFRQPWYVRFWLWLTRQR